MSSQCLEFFGCFQWNHHRPKRSTAVHRSKWSDFLSVVEPKSHLNTTGWSGWTHKPCEPWRQRPKPQLKTNLCNRLSTDLWRGLGELKAILTGWIQMYYFSIHSIPLQKNISEHGGRKWQEEIAIALHYMANVFFCSKPRRKYVFYTIHLRSRLIKHFIIIQCQMVACYMPKFGKLTYFAWKGWWQIQVSELHLENMCNNYSSR